jgi:hypothetical protein
MRGTARPEVTIMRREWLLSIGALTLAFLAAQHHNLMMTLFAVGLGGMGFMAHLPWLRDAMLAMSLVMVAAIAWQITRPGRPRAMQITGALSILFTLAIAGWSLLQVGL